MLKSYFKIALRGLQKNKLISFINIFGLGLSMSIGLMVMIRLQDQLSYDTFHPHADRTYRVTSNYVKKTGEQWDLESSPLPLNDKLRREFNGIESAVTVYPAFTGNVKSSGKEIYISGAFTESSFFTVFGFQLENGDPATALTKPNSVVISKATAEKYFGTADALGQVLTLQTGENFIVTGVLRDQPGKSHLSFEAYASLASVNQLENNKSLQGKLSDWYALNAGYSYVLLTKGTAVKNLQAELNRVAGGLNKDNKEGVVSFALQSINKITPGNNWTKFYVEIGIAMIILLAACFNYTNLTIARSLTRAKEVGVRKVSGAKRIEVFIQYMIESGVLCLVALSFSWVLLSFIIRYAPFNDGYEFIPSSFHYNTALFLGSVAFALFTAIIAGGAPAWILSSFKPLDVLKNLTTARIMGKVSIQKALIVFQYSLSLTIIIFLCTFYRQFSFMSALDPGFRRDHVLIVPLNGVNKDLAAQKVAMISGVTSTGSMSSTFIQRFGGMNTIAWTSDKKDAMSLNYYFADGAFIRNMQFALLAGNNFSPAAETQVERSIIVNEQAAIALGYKDYRKAIGKTVWINDSTKLEIAGVLKDFIYEGAGRQLRPLAFRTGGNQYKYLYVTTTKSDQEKLTNQISASMKTLAPTQIFKPVWLREELEKNNSQAATISLLGYLAFMAVSIASLGLLGLVIYTVQTKRKEISIRKIIGAQERQLVGLLSKGFVRLLFIAGFIAIPIGYVAGFLFLQNFVNRVTAGFGNALLCFLFLLIIGLFTIISQTWKAATANPVTDLRRE